MSPDEVEKLTTILNQRKDNNQAIKTSPCHQPHTVGIVATDALRHNWGLLKGKSVYIFSKEAGKSNSRA